MLIAITRPPTDAIADCLLTYMDREPIDVHRAATQHSAYRALLAELGADVLALPGLDDLPDAVFVEDNAVVLPEVAVLCNMSDPARAPEVESIEDALASHREVRRIAPPGTLEGGDTFMVGRTIYVGLSSRTNDAGASQLEQLLEPYGYHVHRVGVTGCLHLSTGATHIGDGVVVANTDWVDADAIRNGPEEVRLIGVPDEEPWGANAMRVNDTVVMHAGHPRTRALIEAEGYSVRTVDISEFMKAEAGLTCMRLLFDPAATPARKPSDDRLSASFRLTS